jgi:hypothetical protein
MGQIFINIFILGQREYTTTNGVREPLQAENVIAGEN